MTSKRPKFSNLALIEESDVEYDLSIFALGFESRAVNLLPSVAKRTRALLALGFDHGRELAYEENKRAFSDASVRVEDGLSDREFEEVLRGHLKALDGESHRMVFVDVSCFSRFRLASIVHELFSLSQSLGAGLTIDFAYSLAKFEKPDSIRQPNTVVGPAHRAFAGWSQGGYSSTAAVLGLGYEQDQALGVVEFLQAGEVWAFTPKSPVVEYKAEVDKANDLLLSEIPPNRVLEYDVCAPTSVLATLESVVRGLGDGHSVVLVPFGPKIFVLCSLIVAAMRNEIAVWRVSQGTAIKPSDRAASHVQVGLRVAFPPQDGSSSISSNLGSQQS
ncbi:hypothetical protein R16034_04404 [Ralstonia edaphis]|uniref:Uncharacterized protein n=1 Tax=Ralstonia edaphi TaxID=3058599 RepID=A0AB72X8B9_9RALS|nr:hypothetical protein [Ralstonia sp. LMG 6871]CAJ0744384.1 hypothetical protein R16034_04404 [Ralstonia sp. LMG 6871]